jgi:hypothetical protein
VAKTLIHANRRFGCCLNLIRACPLDEWPIIGLSAVFTPEIPSKGLDIIHRSIGTVGQFGTLGIGPKATLGVMPDPLPLVKGVVPGLARWS